MDWIGNGSEHRLDWVSLWVRLDLAKWTQTIGIWLRRLGGLLPCHACAVGEHVNVFKAHE